MELTIFQIPSLFTAAGAFFLGLFILLKNRNTVLNRTFFCLCLSVMVWQLGNVLSWASLSEKECLFWGKILYIGVTFISAFYYHFSVEFNAQEGRRRWVGVFYIQNILMLLFLLRNDFFSGVSRNLWGIHVLAGPSHKYFLLLWFIPVVMAFSNFYNGFRFADSSFEKQRRKFLAVCYGISALGVVDFLPTYNIAMPFPFGFLPIIFFIASTTYAIVRYRILDIKIILKRVSIITFLAVVATVLIYITPFYFQDYLKRLWGKHWIFFPVSLAFVIGLFIVRVVALIRSLEGSELAKKFTYRPILRKEAERFSKVKNMNELLSFLTRDLSSWVRLEYVGILIWDHNLKKYVLLRSLSRNKNRKKIPTGIIIPEDDPLIRELIKKQKPLVKSELKYYLDNQSLPFEEIEYFSRVIGRMEDLGAEITVPCFCEGKLLAWVNMGRKISRSEVVTREDLELFASLAGHIARTVHGFMLHDEKINLIVASQNILITAIEAKDSYTRGHTDRVAELSTLIGMRMEKLIRHYPNGISNLKWAAQLHDIGKIGIPDSILLKKGPLTPEEWQMIKEHPINGVNIINPMREWLGDDICAGIMHHHENYDGTGYPAQKKGEDIHLFAQIIRVADAFDAMVIRRPYRLAMSKEEIIGELIKYKGTYFAPHIINAVLDLYNNGEI